MFKRIVSPRISESRIIGTNVHSIAIRTGADTMTARTNTNTMHFSSTSKNLSKIGRKVLKFDDSIEIKIVAYKSTQFPKADRAIQVSKGKESLSLPLDSYIRIKEDKENDKKVLAIEVDDPTSSAQKKMWGTTRALLNNMIQGIQDGYVLPLRMVGVGYRALMEEGKLSLKIGVAHPVLLEIPEGMKVTIPAPQRILLQGPDWPKITQFAAQIRRFRPPEPYNQKGIFVGDETIRKKEGKKR